MAIEYVEQQGRRVNFILRSEVGNITVARARRVGNAVFAEVQCADGSMPRDGDGGYVEARLIYL